MLRQCSLILILTLWAAQPLWSQTTTNNNTNTMTKQEISEEIQALFVTIDAMLEQYGLEIEAFPQFAAIYQAAEQRVAQVQNLKGAAKAVFAGYPDDDPNAIPKGRFIKEMQKWIKAFKDELEGISSKVPVSKKH